MEEYVPLWEKDITNIEDQTKIAETLLSIPKLHNKYMKFYQQELRTLKGLQHHYNILWKEKREAYLHGISEEQYKQGWTLPAKGALLKNEVDAYLQADEHIIKMSLKIGDQQATVEYLKEILNNFKALGYNLKSAIEIIKFNAAA